MADELDWPIEAMPDADSVFMRAHRVHFSNGELHPGVFKEHGGGMSVNWEKYASALETKQQATKNPEDNAVISLPVIAVRQIRDLNVEHTPTPANRAHSDVCGFPTNRELLTQARVKLLRISQVVIPLTHR